MQLERDFAHPVPFVLLDNAGEPLPGAEVSALISRDGGAFVAPIGAVAEIGAGFYLFAGTQEDFSCEAFALRFFAIGARDTRLCGTTTATRAQSIELRQLIVAVRLKTDLIGASVVDGFLTADRAVLEIIAARFAPLPPGPAAVLPVPVPGLAPLVPVVFDAMTWGLARAGVRIKVALAPESVEIAGRFEVARVASAVTDDTGRALVNLYPSSVLVEAGHSGEYHATCAEAGIDALFSVPDGGGTLSQLLELV